MRKIVFIVLSLIPSIVLAGTLKLPVTRDVGICAHKNEVSLNTGGNSRIRVKGNEHYYLFNFDTKQIRGWKITKATLHVKLARGHLRKVAFCTVPYEWSEGTAVNRPQKGSTCFTHLKYPDKPWTPHGGTMLDATFNSPYMMWRASDVKAGRSGWLEIPIAPELIQAVAVGLSHGLVMSDEKGQTRENHDIYTREQAGAKPYLLIEGQPWHIAGGLSRPAVKITPFVPASGFGTGAIRIDTSWPGKKVFGSRVYISETPLLLAYRLEKTVRSFVTLSDPAIVVEGLMPSTNYYVRVDSFIGPQPFVGKAIRVRSSPVLATPKAPKLTKPNSAMPAGGVHKGWVW